MPFSVARNMPVAMKYEPCTKTLTAVYQSNVNAYKQQKRCDNHGQCRWERRLGGAMGKIGAILIPAIWCALAIWRRALSDWRDRTARNLHIGGTVQL